MRKRFLVICNEYDQVVSETLHWASVLGGHEEMACDVHERKIKTEKSIIKFGHEWPDKLNYDGIFSEVHGNEAMEEAMLRIFSGESEPADIGYIGLEPEYSSRVGAYADVMCKCGTEGLQAPEYRKEIKRTYVIKFRNGLGMVRWTASNGRILAEKVGKINIQEIPKLGTFMFLKYESFIEK